MNKPLVSIIMPAYNVENFIAESIKSVINQTYTNWELLVVNDCSTDSTRRIISDYSNSEKRIKLINRSINGGKPSVSKNSAIKYIQGKYIAFLDSDDLWLPSKLEEQMKFIQNSSYSLVYTGGYLINEFGEIKKEFSPKNTSGFNLKNLLLKYEINNQSVLITLDAFNSTLGKFNENITIGEDYNLFMHIAAKYEIGVIKDCLIKYRIHNNSITQSVKRVSDGVFITLKELDVLYNIKKRYFLYYCIAYLKAARFKFFRKNWNVK